MEYLPNHLYVSENYDPSAKYRISCYFIATGFCKNGNIRGYIRTASERKWRSIAMPKSLVTSYRRATSTERIELLRLKSSDNIAKYLVQEGIIY